MILLYKDSDFLEDLREKLLFVYGEQDIATLERLNKIINELEAREQMLMHDPKPPQIVTGASFVTITDDIGNSVIYMFGVDVGQ